MRQSFYGSPHNHPIFLDDLVCNGTEDSLLSCPCKYDSNGMATLCGVGESDCSHDEDAGVRCDGETTLTSKMSFYHFVKEKCQHHNNYYVHRMIALFCFPRLLPGRGCSTDD